MHPAPPHTPWTSLAEADDYARGLLHGERVSLRPLHEDDVPVLERWWADPTVAVLQTPAVRPQPAGEMGGSFRQWSRNADATGVGFAVTDRESGELLGHVVLYGAEVATRVATTAVVLGPEHTGRGYGTDAMRTIVRYGFDEMGLHRIELSVFAYNERAIATYRKVGFREEGRRREAVFHGGRFHDSVLMGLLVGEWRESR